MGKKWVSICHILKWPKTMGLDRSGSRQDFRGLKISFAETLGEFRYGYFPPKLAASSAGIDCRNRVE